MDAKHWSRLLSLIQGAKGTSLLKIEDGRIELDGQLAFDGDNQTQIGVVELVAGLAMHGCGHQACTLLLMCPCNVRATMFLGIESQCLRALQHHEDKAVRELFEKAVLGALEVASKAAAINPNAKTSAANVCLNRLRPCCSPYLLARLALWGDQSSDFWEAYAKCSDEQKQGLLPLVPQELGLHGQSLGVSSTSGLFAWARESIEMGFKTGPSEGLAACEAWLDRTKKWDEAGNSGEGDASLRSSLVRGAVAHALAEHTASNHVSSAQTDGLLDRAWAGGLTLPAWLAVPAPYRERLLSAAVEQAANAATTQALDGLVHLYLALHEDPGADLEDGRWLGECLRSAFDSVLAPDSGRTEVECNAIRRMRTRMERGLSEQFTDHVKHKRYAAAADCIGEMCLLWGPSFGIERFNELMEHFSGLLSEVGLGYGLRGDGVHVYKLPEASDKGLQDITRRASELAEQIREVESQGDASKAGRLKDKLAQTNTQLMQVRQARPMQQRLALERVLSMLARCGLGEMHSLETRVRDYLEKEAVPLDRCDEKTRREIGIHRARTNLMVQSRRDWRVGMGPLWETRQWLDQLIDLGAYGRVCLGEEEPLRTTEFGLWRDLMSQGGKGSASHALLVSAVAAAMDGEHGDAISMTWLFEQFAEGVDLQSVLMSMPPVPTGESPASGVDRFLRFAYRLASQRNWLSRMEDTTSDHWQPGWKMLLDFCRFLAEQPDLKPESVGEGFQRYAADFNNPHQLKLLDFLKPIWVKDLVHGVADVGPVHEMSMSPYQAPGKGMNIEHWEDAFKEMCAMVEPHVASRNDGLSKEAWVRNNLAKGLLRFSDGLRNSRRAACPRPGSSIGSSSPFEWKSHWASALVSAYRDTLSQSKDMPIWGSNEEDIAALWSGAAKAYPQWLDKDIRPDDAVWVKDLIEIFESKDLNEAVKRERLSEKVAAWRKALQVPKVL